MSGDPVLYYFPFAGRGEMSRLIAAAGGLKIVNGDLPADRAALCAECGGVGQGLPVLTHGDLKICQSQAIQNYISHLCPKFQDLPPKARAIDMMVCCHVEDFIGECGASGVLGLLFAGDRDNFKKDACHGSLKKWLGHLECLAPEEGFINGLEYPTAADCAAVMLFHAHTPYTHIMREAEFDPTGCYPKLAGLAGRAAAAPGIKEYLECSGTLKFDPFAQAPAEEKAPPKKDEAPPVEAPKPVEKAAENSADAVRRSATGTLKHTEDSDAAAGIMTLKELQDRAIWSAKGVDPGNRETHLADEEFQSIFQMSKGEWAAVPKWKKDTLKKKHGLF